MKSSKIVFFFILLKILPFNLFELALAWNIKPIFKSDSLIKIKYIIYKKNKNTKKFINKNKFFLQTFNLD
jgi:hypothetical protein